MRIWYSKYLQFMKNRFPEASRSIVQGASEYCKATKKLKCKPIVTVSLIGYNGKNIYLPAYGLWAMQCKYPVEIIVDNT